MQTGPDRFDRLVTRTVDLLHQHAEVGASEAESILSGLVLEHEVVRRRWAPRLQALRDMGEALDAIDIRWSSEPAPAPETAEWAMLRMAAAAHAFGAVRYTVR